jgi:hypothetical protein
LSSTSSIRREDLDRQVRRAGKRSIAGDARQPLARHEGEVRQPRLLVPWWPKEASNLRAAITHWMLAQEERENERQETLDHPMCERRHRLLHHRAVNKFAARFGLR